jgi:hypothetical protein
VVRAVGHYICAIDGVYHHSFEKVHCEQCLHKTVRNGSVSYSHGALQGALMHPDHPRLGLIITGDGLFSKAPMIGQVSAAGMYYLFVAKPKDHTYMMGWLKGYPQLPLVESQNDKGRTHQFRYMNRVPLNGSKSAPEVNYLHYQMVNCSGKVAFTNSWVTDIEVRQANFCALAKGGRCCWKIENECFNTLKNQGYHLEHNFGHGKKHLNHNVYLLTLLAVAR